MSKYAEVSHSKKSPHLQCKQCLIRLTTTRCDCRQNLCSDELRNGCKDTCSLVSGGC